MKRSRDTVKTPGVIERTAAAGRPGADSTRRVMLAVAAVAVLVRLVPATVTYGTSDVMTWELLGRMLLNGENFYATQLHNWPVLWIYLCAVAVALHDALGLPFALLIKLPPIGADACIVALLAHVGAARGGRRAALVGGLAYALNPVSVLISGYHGQFDSLMLAPTVLAWQCFPRRCERGGGGFFRPEAPHSRRHLATSALALGLGIWFKPVPLLLLPVFLPRLAGWRERARYTALAVAPAALGTLPYFVRWPEDVATNFLGYSSWFGQWGYPVVWMLVEYLRDGTLPWWLPDPDHVSPALHLMYLAGRWVLLAALAATWSFTFRPGMSLLRSIVAIFAVFYVATSGFGLQYLVWIIPFAILRRDRWLWPFTLTATGLLLVAYRFGVAYLPLSVTPDNAPSAREFVVKLASLPTWLVCGLWAWSLLRRRSALAAPVAAGVVARQFRRDR